MVFAVGVAVSAALAGQDGSGAVAPAPAAEPGTLHQSAAEGASILSQLPAEQRSASSRSLQALAGSESPGVALPELTSTIQTRSELISGSLKSTPTPITASARPPCEAGAVAAYCVYTVQEGDTLSSIAAAFGLKSEHVPGWELLVASNAPDIVSAEDFIQPGQKLRVPAKSGVVHTVILDETIGDMAEAFDVSSASIIAANGISDRNLIAIGQVLLIPDPQRIPSPNATTGQAAPGTAGSAAAEPTPEPVRGFIWPITATVRITNYFGPAHPLGIDFGLSHAPGTPVVAVAPGKVVFAGGDACCSYGYYVIVDHENGLKTLYAHLRSIDVSVGQRVSQGQALGPSGATGYSTGVHLHFEVHKNGVQVDPLPYLPR